MEKIEVYFDEQWVLVDDLSCISSGVIFRFVSDGCVGATLIAFDKNVLVKLPDGSEEKKITCKVLNMNNTVVCVDCSAILDRKVHFDGVCPICSGDLKEGDPASTIRKNFTRPSFLGRKRFLQ